MVSVAVLALERTDLHFIDAIGVKIMVSTTSCSNFCLTSKSSHFSDYFTFQQDSAPAHRSICSSAWHPDITVASK